MDQGFNVTDAGTLAAIRGVTYPHHGYGYHHDHGNFRGDGSAVNENVKANRDFGLVEAVNRSTTEQLLSDRITAGNANIIESINTQNQFITDRITAQSLNDRFASIDRLILAGQASNEREFRTLDVKLTECCCKLEAGQAAIIAKLDAQALNAAQTENQRLNMQIQIMNQSRGGQGN